MNNVIKAIQAIYPEVKDGNGNITDAGIKGGFVYWETKLNGSDLDNPIDGLKWENIEYAKPTWEQIEAEFVNVDLQEAKDKKIIELKANKAIADLQDHHHSINGSWYAFHMDLESRNLLANILFAATSVLGLDPKDPNDDNVVVYSGFGVDEYDTETEQTGNKAVIDLTYAELRNLFNHMKTRLGNVYILYMTAKTNINNSNDIDYVNNYDVSIGYTAV